MGNDFGGMRGEREDRGGGGGIAAIAMIFLAPFAAMLIQLAVSRSREYGADDTARPLDGQSLCAGQRLVQNRKLLAPLATGGEPIDGASIHHSAVPGWNEFRQSVFDPSADGEEDRAVDGKAGGIFQ